MLSLLRSATNVPAIAFPTFRHAARRCQGSLGILLMAGLGGRQVLCQCQGDKDELLRVSFPSALGPMQAYSGPFT